MLKTGFRNLQLAIRLKQANFENPTHNFDALVFPTPSSHSLEQLSTFYSVGVECLTNEWQMRNRSGLHRVTLPGISFINIRCQSRLEGNHR